MQAAGFGPLQEGVVVTCSSALVRQLLASPPPPVRDPPWAYAAAPGSLLRMLCTF